MKIYVDGSAHPNPGPGGFGVVALDNNNKVIFCHQEQKENTTNNEMELTAIRYALGQVGSQALYGEPYEVYSDSSYAVNTLNKWKENWKLNGWKKPNGQEPENLTLIQSYDTIENIGYKINLIKIRGHVGILGNELADLLATGKITEQEVIEKYGR